MAPYEAITSFIDTLTSIDYQQIFSWLPSTFAGAVISIIGVLIALRILEVI